jgi:hypothetical protein
MINTTCILKIFQVIVTPLMSYQTVGGRVQDFFYCVALIFQEFEIKLKPLK